MTYMSLIPLTEGGSIDLDDSALHKGVCSHQLVVRRVVDLLMIDQGANNEIDSSDSCDEDSMCTHDTNDTSLSCDVL